MESLAVQFVDCPCSGKNLPRLVQPTIMAILAREPLHGYRILEALDKELAAAPDPAGVYRYLKMLARDGYVTDCEDDQPSGGPARRRFRLTEKGFDCLRAWRLTLRRYQNDVAALIAFMDKSLPDGEG